MALFGPNWMHLYGVYMALLSTNWTYMSLSEANWAHEFDSFLNKINECIWLRLFQTDHMFGTTKWNNKSIIHQIYGFSKLAFKDINTWSVCPVCIYKEIRVSLGVLGCPEVSWGNQTTHQSTVHENLSTIHIYKKKLHWQEYRKCTCNTRCQQNRNDLNQKLKSNRIGSNSVWYERMSQF